MDFEGCYVMLILFMSYRVFFYKSGQFFKDFFSKYLYWRSVYADYLEKRVLGNYRLYFGNYCY